MAREVVYRRMTDSEKQALTDKGALVWSLSGRPIKDQPAYQTALKAHGIHLLTSRSRGDLELTKEQTRRLEELVNSPSREIDIAFFPNPDRFFVSDSFLKEQSAQLRMLSWRSKHLRLQTGLSDLRYGLPTASDALEIIFGFWHATGQFLLDQRFKFHESLLPENARFDADKDGNMKYLIMRTATEQIGVGPYHEDYSDLMVKNYSPSQYTTVGMACMIMAQQR